MTQAKNMQMHTLQPHCSPDTSSLYCVLFLIIAHFPSWGLNVAIPSRTRSSPFLFILRDKRKLSAGGENRINEKDASSQLIGITFLFIVLCFNGSTGAYEDKLMSVHSIRPFGHGLWVSCCVLLFLVAVTFYT